MDEFRAGVTACLRSWSALRTAVESGWGGANSADKADVLRSAILELFHDGGGARKKNIADDIRMDLEDALAIYMEEEFSLTLEDDSERQIADVIWRMYVQCAAGDEPTLAKEMMDIADQAAAQDLPPVCVQSPEHDDDDDDDDDDEEMEDMDDNPSDNNSTVAAAAAAATPPTPTTIGTQGAVPAVSMNLRKDLSAAEYAAQPLFGPTSSPSKGMGGAATSGPVRQLGEAPDDPIHHQQKHVPVVVDEDGFAPVVTKKKSSRNHG
jgi:pre-rRNA-processing protein TSR2